jgi:hypothetical protein
MPPAIGVMPIMPMPGIMPPIIGIMPPIMLPIIGIMLPIIGIMLPIIGIMPGIMLPIIGIMPPIMPGIIIMGFMGIAFIMAFSLWLGWPGRGSHRSLVGVLAPGVGQRKRPPPHRGAFLRPSGETSVRTGGASALARIY